MKETIAVILIWVGATVANFAFWIWLVSLLVWKMFEVHGASTMISPSFYTMSGGAIAFIIGLLVEVKSLEE